MILFCSDFDEAVSPSTDTPRMQLVFERPHEVLARARPTG